MTLTLEIKPETEASLRSLAARRGLELPALLEAMVADAEEEAAAEAIQDELDAQEARHILATSDPSQRRTLADLRAHIDAQKAAEREAA